jgi:hypothetical protein
LVQETIVTNVGEDDKSSLASEATLLDLLDVMEKMAKASGADPAAARAKTEKLLLETKKASITVIREHTDALEESTESSRRLTKTFNGLYSATAGLIGGLVGLGASFTNELINGSDRLSDFTRHIPVFGSVFTPLVKFIETTVDNFRMLSSVGAAFGNSLEELRRTAAMARLPLDEFSLLIQNNSERLIFLGSTVSDGARRFAEIAGELRGNDGLFGALKAMGFTTEEVNEGLANYINLQGRLGRIQGRSNAELATGAAEYLHQLDRLSKVTGRQRSEIEKELERLNLDAGVRALEQQLIDQHGANSEQVRNFREAQMQIVALPADLQDAARSMLLGLPTDEAARLMATGGNELYEALQEIARGADPQILRDAFVATGRNLQEFVGTGPGSAQLIEGFRRAGISFFDYSQDLIRLGQSNLDDARVEQARRDGIIENLTRFDDRIRDIRATIQEALIKSGVFELLATSVSSLAGLINGPEGMAAIRNGIESMTNFFAGFIEDISTMGFWSAITNAFVDLAMNIWEEISLRLFGGTRDTSDQQNEINDRIRNLESQRSGLASAFQSGTETDEERRELAALDAQVEQLRLRSASLAAQHGEEVEGVLSGMFSNLFNGSNHREIEEALAPVTDEIRNLEEQRNQLISQGEFGIVDENTSAELERISQRLRELNEQRNEIDSERQSGFLSELLSLENIFSTGGVLLLGLAAGAAAIALIGTKAALVAVAIGFAAGGIGYLLENLKPVIDSVFDGMATVIDSVGENIQGIIDSLSGGFTSAVQALTPMIDIVFDGIGSTIDSIGENIQGIIDSLSGGFTSAVQELTPMIDIVFDGIGSTIDSIGENIQGIIDSLSGGFTSAVQELTPMIDTVFNGISEVIDSVGGTIQNTITSITDGISNIIGRITDFRTAGTDATTNQIERLSQIESERLVAAAEGITAMKSALEGFGTGASGTLDRIGSFFGRQTTEERQASSFERLASLGPGLAEVSRALNEIVSIENLGENVNSLAENLNSRSLRNYNSELRTMLEILRQINDELSRDTRRTNWRGQVVDPSETANPAASALSQGMGSSSGTESRLDRLNTTMSELLRVAQEQLSVLADIEDNTDDMSGDISMGGMTAFRGGR